MPHVGIDPTRRRPTDRGDGMKVADLMQTDLKTVTPTTMSIPCQTDRPPSPGRFHRLHGHHRSAAQRDDERLTRPLHLFEDRDALRLELRDEHRFHAPTLDPT